MPFPYQHFLLTSATSGIGAAFDVSQTEKISQFVADRRYDLAAAEGFDIEQFQYEVQVYFTNVAILTHAFLPILKAKTRDGSGVLIFTGTNLAIIPAASMPAYSAADAGLNAFVLCLRHQLKKTNVKVIDLSPPAVQIELHDYMSPKIGRSVGMPLDQFIDEAFAGLLSGKDQVVVGSIGPVDLFHQIVNKRREAFEELAALMDAR